MSGRDPLAVLSRRIDVLEVLAGDRAHKPALVEALDVSRSTIDRALRELEEFEYVRRTDAGYEATPAGRLARRAYRRLERQIDAISGARPLFRGLDPNALPPPAVLVGADVEVAEPPAVHHPLERLKDLVRRAERYRGLAQVFTDEEFVNVFRRAVLERDVTIEFVFAEPMLEYLCSEWGDAVGDLAVEDDVSLFVCETVPYGLAIAETPDGPEICLVLYGEGGDLAGIVANDTPTAIAWARESYREVRERAREVDVSRQ